MANLNEVTLQLKVQGEKEATTTLKRFKDAQGRMSTSVLDAARKLESISSRWKEADRLLQKNTLSTKAHRAAQTQLAREYANLNGMTETYVRNGKEYTRTATNQAKAAIILAQQTQQAQREQDQQNRRFEELRMRLDPAYRATQQYEAAINELNLAYRSGAIGQDLYIDQMARAEQEMQLVALGGRGARRSMNGANMAIQQAGYQFSDFAIQVQGGTSAFVAFSQQASQLVGVLPLVAENVGLSAAKAVALSSGLAIAIPLITVAANVFFEMSKEAKEAEEELSALDDGLKSLDSTLQSWLRTREAAAEGITVEELLGLEGAESAVERLSKERQAIVDALQAQLPGVDLSDYSTEMASILASSTQYTDVLGELIEAETRLGNIRRKQGEEQFTAFSESLTQLQQQLDLEQEIAQFGSESAQVRRLELEQEIANRKTAIDQQVESKEITISQGIALKNLVEETLRLASANETSAEFAQSLFDIFDRMSMDNILVQMDSLNSKLGSAIFGAGTLSARLGNVFAAGVAAAERAKIQQEQQQARAEGFRFDSTKENGGVSTTEAFFTGRLGFSNAPNTRDGIMRGVKSSGGGGGGGGGGAGSAQADYLAKLEAEAAFKRTLIGLTEEQARVEERRRDITERLTKDGEALSETEKARIESILQMEAGTRRLIEAEEQRTAMIDTFSNQMENALMSMVDGSKTVGEAFSGLIRSMLLEVYKQQVAEPGARAFGKLISGLFQADGGAWNKGVQMYANGGVVGGPTAFGHSGGLGIMGEAGPEAIMPLKRGANGKLGVQMEGGGTTVVNQYFNISANGDESVKRIIRKESPRIAEQAKAAVVDAKRRGGTYGRSFT